MLWSTKLLEHYKVPFILPVRISNLKKAIRCDYERYQYLKQCFAEIEFSCFQKGGSCYNRKKKSMCCCSDCFNTIGFFELSDIIEQKDIETYDKLFQNRHGFWTPKGCSLPYHLRSITCISYNCEGQPKRQMLNALAQDVRLKAKLIREQTASYLSMHIMKPRINNMIKKKVKADSKS